jgi:hypothetical protein
MLSGFIAWGYLLFLPNLSAGGLLPAMLAWPAVLRGFLPHAWRISQISGGRTARLWRCRST